MELTKERRERYANIASMKELRLERNRLDIELKIQKLELLTDAEMLRERLSAESVYNSIYGAVYQRYKVVRNSVVGFRVVRSLFRQFLDKVRGVGNME